MVPMAFGWPLGAPIAKRRSLIDCQSVASHTLRHAKLTKKGGERGRPLPELICSHRSRMEHGKLGPLPSEDSANIMQGSRFRKNLPESCKAITARGPIPIQGMGSRGDVPKPPLPPFECTLKGGRRLARGPSLPRNGGGVRDPPQIQTLHPFGTWPAGDRKEHNSSHTADIL